MDVYYDVSSANPPVTVSILVSTNGGASYTLPASSFSGDVGPGVSPGSNRKIVWDASADWGGQFSTAVRFKVTASDASAPPGFVLIPAGSFEMGDSFTEGDTDELPVHAVYVSAFYMQATETTKAQWDEVREWASTHGYTDLPTGGGKASDHPVQTVTWYDVVKWCNARSEKEGLAPCYTVSGSVYKTGSSAPECNLSTSGYRLPTEAEWEKAARGGENGHRFPWGDADTISHSRANYYSYSSYAYDVSPTRDYHPTFATGVYPYTSPAGYFAPNGYGLYDMAGNVWEWCWDWYGSTYYSTSPSGDPTGPTTGSYRVLRGGVWDYGAGNCRVARRRNGGPDYSYSNGSLGFRPVRR